MADDMGWWGYGEIRALIYWWEEYEMCFGKALGQFGTLQFLKRFNTKWHMTKQFYSEIYTQENWKYVSVQTHIVQSSTIHNIQRVETTQMSIKWWMGSQNIVYLYNGILFSHEKEVSTMLQHGRIWKACHERSQIRNATYHIPVFLWNILGKFIKTEIRLVVAKVWRKGRMDDDHWSIQSFFSR